MSPCATGDACDLELSDDGYLRLDAEAARRFFPDDVLVPLVRDGVLALLPTRGNAAGGLILKQRNPRGDRSVLIAEAFRFRMPAGRYAGVWNDAVGGLCIDMRPRAVGLPRPQPVGVAAFPESHVLVPPGGADARLVEAYNRFVRRPTPLDFAELLAAGDATLTPLARAVAFAHGLVDDLPEPGPLDGELAALVLMTAAAGLLEQADMEAACDRLATAIELAAAPTPAFAATLALQLADVLASQDPAAAIPRLEQALALAESAPAVRGEILMKLGYALQSAANGSRALLLEAVNAYQRALQEGITAESHPDWFGQIHNNLGLAHLSTPTLEASDQLRTAIAVQSFRHALRMYDRERSPDMWATVAMNLANALQHLPSSHPEENLIEAVEGYEQVLQIRTEARDPVAHALALVNQANALAHLGIFKPAIEKAAHAYKLFTWHEQAEQAATAKELHDTLQDKVGQASACQK